MYVDEDNDFCDRCGRNDSSQLIGGESDSEVSFGWHPDPSRPDGQRTEDLCGRCMNEVNLKPCYVCGRWMPADDDDNPVCSQECADKMMDEDHEGDVARR